MEFNYLKKIFAVLTRSAKKSVAFATRQAGRTLLLFEKRSEKYIDRHIARMSVFLFVVLISSELLYSLFFGMQLHLSKIFLLFAYSMLLGFSLSLIKYVSIQRLFLLGVTLLIDTLYFLEATYFVTFKKFALWPELNRLDDLATIRNQVVDFLHAEFLVFYLPFICLSCFYIGLVISKRVRRGRLFTEAQIKRQSFKQKVVGTSMSLAALAILSVYYVSGVGDLNKMYLKNSVDYVNRYSLFDAFGFNSIQALLPWFKESEPSDAAIEREFKMKQEPNAHTNLYQDKNLIFIEGESIAPFAIDPVLTPNLYRLQQESYTFNNYYSPRANTFNSEYALMNSFYLTPEKEDAPFTSTGSIAGLFKNLGYSTHAFHDFVGDFYGRVERIPQVGFDVFYDVDDLGLVYTWLDLPSDVDLFARSFPYIAGKDRFLSYYITMSAHTPYRIDVRDGLRENFAQVQARFPDYPEEIQTYFAGAMVTDQGIGQLFADLSASGQLDNTVIVFVGDHYPYGIKMPPLQALFGIERELDVYKTPFFIWDASAPSEVREDIMSNVDVLPTIANLFGLDLKYGMGQDMFSAGVADVIVEWYDFRAYSFLTPKGGYDGLLNQIVGDLSANDVHELQQRIYRRETMNNSLYVKELLRPSASEERIEDDEEVLEN